MSHVVKVDVEITSLHALGKAAQRLGGQLVAQQTFKHYFSLPGRCDYAITFPDCEYQVGITKLQGRAQETFDLAWDPYERALANRMGGEDAAKLVEAYSIETAIAEMAAAGATLQSETVREDGTVELEFVGL